MEEGNVTMSKKALTRLEVIQRVADGQMRQRDAAQVLSVSVRQIKRLLRAFREMGAAGLVCKRRGQPSNHRFDAGFKAQALDRLRTSYPDFGPTLAAEYLRGDGLPLSRETLRQWMIEDGLWRVAKQRG